MVRNMHNSNLSLCSCTLLRKVGDRALKEKLSGCQSQASRSENKPMWIVRLALNRPYTFIVLALLILLLSPAVIVRTPTDIFPNINIPVISVAWTYTGLNPEDIEARLTTPYEKGLTTLVDNIEHIESSSYNGV